MSTRLTQYVVRCTALACGAGHSEERFDDHDSARERALLRIEMLGFERVWLIRREEESLPLPEPPPYMPTFVATPSGSNGE